MPNSQYSYRPQDMNVAPIRYTERPARADRVLDILQSVSEIDLDNDQRSGVVADGEVRLYKVGPINDPGRCGRFRLRRQALVDGAGDGQVSYVEFDTIFDSGDPAVEKVSILTDALDATAAAHDHALDSATGAAVLTPGDETLSGDTEVSAGEVVTFAGDNLHQQGASNMLVGAIDLSTADGDENIAIFIATADNVTQAEAWTAPVTLEEGSLYVMNAVQNGVFRFWLERVA